MGSRQVVAHLLRPTPAENPDQVAHTIGEAVLELAKDREIEAVGLGAAGFVDETRSIVRFAPNLAWREEPLQKKVSDMVGLPVVGWLVGGAPTELDVPKLSGFGMRGGRTVSPEFTALLIGLTTYTAAFIAEVVRGGILAVDRGQTEAAKALGLGPGKTLRLVTLPQALRVIVPPMTSQYLNLTKNSSLAVAIGYPELVSVANTSMNQTGQAIEAIAILMAVYLAISLVIAIIMNVYNSRVRLVER